MPIIPKPTKYINRPIKIKIDTLLASALGMAAKNFCILALYRLRLCYTIIMVKLKKLLISLIVSFAAGAIGSLATFPNIPTWYAGLAKPGFNPPNWVFGPVWTLLYVLMGVSLYLVWTTQSKKPKNQAFTFFAAQLVLNALWSLVFFGAHALWLGVGVILALWLCIAWCIKLFWPFSRPAAWLLAPYLAWVSFATALNIAVALLN